MADGGASCTAWHPQGQSFTQDEKKAAVQEYANRLGIAASANLHPGARQSLFEPVHGSAPALAGKGIANPVAAVLTGGLMFEHLGYPAAAATLKQAVRKLLASSKRPPDLGGDAGTAAVVDALGDLI